MFVRLGNSIAQMFGFVTTPVSESGKFNVGGGGAGPGGMTTDGGKCTTIVDGVVGAWPGFGAMQAARLTAACQDDATVYFPSERSE